MQVIIQVQMFPTINAKVTLTQYKTTEPLGLISVGYKSQHKIY